MIGDGVNAPARPLARTFKPRRRRLGPRRAAVWSAAMPRFGLTETGPDLDLRETFSGASRICVEIGSGNGDLASHVARHRSDTAIVAIDVHRPGIARLLDDAASHDLGNLRVVDGDALVFVERLVDASIDEIWAFFPDPWPKNSQAHRRLFTSERLVRLARVLRPGGCLRIATDVEVYARAIRRVVEASDLFDELDEARPEWRIETVFERTGREAGRASVDLSARRTDAPIRSD